MMFVLELRRGAETRTFSISSVRGAGWELSEIADRQAVRIVRYNDWHRVERAIALIREAAAGLQRDGWKASLGEP